MVRPRIGVDARLYGLSDRGLGRYTAEILEALRGVQDQFSFTVFIRPDRTRRASLEGKGFRVIDAPFSTYGIAEQFRYPRHIVAAGVDLMHFPHLNVPFTYRRPFVMTVHDLILHHFPSRYVSTLSSPLFWMKYAAYRLTTRSAMARAAAIIAVSHFTREDITMYYPEAENRVVVIPESPPLFTERSLRNDSHSDLMYTFQRPYALVVGAFYPHKNTERLVRVWDRLKPDLTLVFVGREDLFAKRLKKIAADNIICQNFI